MLIQCTECDRQCRLGHRSEPNPGRPQPLRYLRTGRNTRGPAELPYPLTQQKPECRSMDAPPLHPGHRRHSNDNPHGTTLPGCFWVTQSLPFGSLGTGSEARWLEGGSTFPAEPVPRSLARQQQVPKTEPTSAACFGGGRHGVGPSPSAETEKRRHLGHFGLPPASV